MPFDYNIDEALKKIYHEQGKDSPAYQVLWQEMMEKRQAGSGHYLRRIQESLEEVCDLSEQRGYGVNLDRNPFTLLSDAHATGSRNDHWSDEGCTPWIMVRYWPWYDDGSHGLI